MSALAWVSPVRKTLRAMYAHVPTVAPVLVIRVSSDAIFDFVPRLSRPRLRLGRPELSHRVRHARGPTRRQPRYRLSLGGTGPNRDGHRQFSCAGSDVPLWRLRRLPNRIRGRGTSD